MQGRYEGSHAEALSTEDRCCSSWLGLGWKQFVKLTDQVLMEPLVYYNTYVPYSISVQCLSRSRVHARDAISQALQVSSSGQMTFVDCFPNANFPKQIRQIAPPEAREAAQAESSSSAPSTLLKATCLSTYLSTLSSLLPILRLIFRNTCGWPRNPGYGLQHRTCIYHNHRNHGWTGSEAKAIPKGIYG